ncbi:MAG TPA: 3-oxoadipate enol-lactonase [Gaiellaceae bacterium]|nr:3-oxoadipate enol-lactonase [Gaiellaceae bacterium]
MSLHHRIDGDGDRVVVLGGSLGSTLEMWEPQLPALTPRFRVLRYDHPGHGGSPLLEVRDVSAISRALIGLLDALELERVSYCGLSLGGAVGMRLALDVPDRIDRLVLCSTSARFSTPEFWQERADTVRRDGIQAIAEVVLERWFTPAFGDVRRYREMLLSIPVEGYARCCEAVRDWDVRGVLAGVTAPTLAIAGADDPSTPPDDLGAIVAEIPGATLLVLDAARHLTNVERAEEFNRAVAAHL